MAEAEHELLIDFELRLLRCSLSPAQNNTPPASTTSRLLHCSLSPAETNAPLASTKYLINSVEDVLASIERGNYVNALSSDAARLVFRFANSWEFHDSIDSADRFYSEVEKSAESFLQSDSEDDSNESLRAVLLMCIGVAAFLVFTQCHMTGPVEDFSAFPVPSRWSKEDKIVGSGGKWDLWAHNQLMLSGSDLLGKFSHLQFIVYAKMLLIKTKDFSWDKRDSCLNGSRSISWWLSRLTLLQQRILDERSSSLNDQLQVLIGETLLHFGELENVTSYWGTKLCEGEALDIVSMAHLEAGIIDHTYGRVDSSRLRFNYAEEACGLCLSLTGVLGFRTVHQVKANAQMVLVCNTNEQKNSDRNCTSSAKLQRNSSVVGKEKMVSHSLEHYDCDILVTPKLVENGNDAGIDAHDIVDSVAATMPLSPVQQTVILAQCLLIQKSNRDDELQGWQIAPFIEAIDAQRFSHFIIRGFCDILRIRWESTRSRTKERALMMMDKLVQGVYESSPGAAQRIHFSYGVYIPTIPSLRKEFGELLVGCGMVGEALKIFEDLELWDNLIYCYRLLGKKAAAVDLINERLSKFPNDSRLWCSLGDVTSNDTYYEKALEVSNQRSARAKRSLARSAYNRGDYETSKIFWESALAINSLFPDGWFALGSAALKARDIDKALDGFTRSVQLDPENGEAWNNIACLHMIKKKSKEAFIAFREALKFRRNSWQLWENYSQVAMDICNFSQALEATKMVLDMTSNKRIDTELLEKLMAEMETRTSKPTLSPSSGIKDPTCTIQTRPGDPSGVSVDDLAYSESGIVRSRETEVLVDLLGKVLQQIVRSGGREDIWGLYARWHKIKGDIGMCSEALLKQVRSYQGADLWHNKDRFKKFVHASLQLCNVYMEIASSTCSRRELTTAEMHLKNTIKQAVNFSDTEEIKDLQDCLDVIKKRLQAENV